MGLLKLLLAAMVVFVHAGPLPGFPTMGGSVAVQAFYSISGFYMALILNEKYVTQPDAYRLFLTNRVLRLLPIYYVVVGLTLLTAVVMTLTLGQPELESFRNLCNNYDRLSGPTLAFVALANLTLIGQDWLSFLTVDPAGALVFTSDFNQAPVNLTYLLLVRPAWTVSLELTFYVVAPFLVRRSAWVLLVGMAASIAIRVGLRQFAHYDSMAWGYRFFPSELLYFLGGALAYKAYRWLKGKPLPVWLNPAIIGFTLLFTLFFGPLHQEITRMGLSGGILSTLYRLTIIATLPFLFLGSKRSKIDAQIGDLCYPLYIVHFLVWEILVASKIGGPHISIYTLVLSLGLAYTINRLVGERIERLRRRIFERHTNLQPSLA